MIPFADEDLFIQAEKELFEAGMTLSAVEWERNTVKFTYPAIMYDKKMLKGQVLQSTLKSMGPLQDDRTRTVPQHDYERVGEFCFPSKLLEGVVRP